MKGGLPLPRAKPTAAQTHADFEALNMSARLGVAERDAVEHPSHYTEHPSGVECIAITEHMSFCVGNAVKYLWRADLKGDPLTDLRKARWYVDREIARRERQG